MNTFNASYKEGIFLNATGHSLIQSFIIFKNLKMTFKKHFK